MAWLLEQRAHPSRERLVRLLLVAEERWYPAASNEAIVAQRARLLRRIEQYLGRRIDRTGKDPVSHE